EVAEDARGAQRFAHAFGAGLALLAGEQLAELVGAGEDRVGDLVEHVGAHFGRGVGPAREGFGRDLDRLVHFSGSAVGETRDHVRGVGGVAAFQRSIRAGPFAGDEVAESAGFHDQILSMRPRPARFRTKAAMPISHGGASREVVTVLTSVPSRRELIVTRSPSLWVKPAPGSSRSCVGANRVPQNSTNPSG